MTYPTRLGEELRRPSPGPDLPDATASIVERFRKRSETGRPDYRTYECRTCRDGLGMIAVGDPTEHTYRPCDDCRPLTYALWQEGHLGHTNRDDCRRCEELRGQHSPHEMLPSHRPSQGDWRDSVSSGFAP